MSLAAGLRRNVSRIARTGPGPQPARGARRGAAAPLLDQALIRQLRRLSLAASGELLAGFGGEHSVGASGQDPEFADYRAYTPGDDLRMIDWNVYARLRELFVKTSPGQGRIALSLLIDCSRSMAFGDPEKLDFAKRVAAQLGAIALLGGDSARVHQLRDGGAEPGAELQGERSIERLVLELDGIVAGGGTDLEASANHYRRLGAQRGLVVVIGDLLSATDPERALPRFAARGGSVAVLHVIDPLEESPSLAGSLELVDAETRGRLHITVTPRLRERYAAAFAARARSVEQACVQAGLTYVRAPTTLVPLELVAGPLRAARIVTG